MLSILAGLLLFGTTQAKAWDVSGVFVEEKGLPQPEAEIARYFMLSGGKAFAVEGLKADAQGHFAGTIKPYQLPLTYIAYNRERSLGALAVLTEESARSPLRIVLKPLAEVSFKPDIEGGYEPVNMAVSLECPGTNLILSYSLGPYRIPEGSYELDFASLEFEKNRKPFTVAPGQKLDLGAVPVKLTPITRNIGKPALPIEFAEARGVPPGFKIGDLKGKWVLLEFWGYW